MLITEISWEQVEHAAELLAQRWVDAEISRVVGVPTGGSVIAPLIAGHLHVPCVAHDEVNPFRSDTLVVDDLVDSGKTSSAYAGNFDALFRKPAAPRCVASSAIEMDGWLRFPWERERDAEDAVVRLLQAIGENPAREGLRDTPRRVVKAMREMTAGSGECAATILQTTFSARCDQIVAVKGIEFTSMCEHHLLPFIGSATVAYLPTDRVVGLSKLARLVDAHARRLQLQEQMTHDIAFDLMEHLKPLGAGCIVKARHLCMGCRGVKKPGAEMITSATLGVFRDDPAVRSEFLELAR